MKTTKSLLFIASFTLLTSLEAQYAPPLEFADDFGDYRSPLRFEDGDAVESSADWAQRRDEILSDWHGLMGAWPEVITEPEVEILTSEQREDFTQHQVRFLWTPTPLPPS
jgi:hypothetical protein